MMRYRVIQRDCHKWKCYKITLNRVFIDFWGIFRFHILGGLLFKATLYHNRNFWFLWPICWCPIVFEGHFFNFLTKHKFSSLTIFLFWTSYVGQSQLFFMWPKWCRQVLLFADRSLGYFPFLGAHLPKILNPALQAENSLLSSRMGSFQESRSVQSLLRIWVWYVPTELGLPGPKKSGYIRRCLKEQLVSGHKKDHVWKIGS